MNDRTKDQNTKPTYTCLKSVGPELRGCGLKFGSWAELVEHEKSHAPLTSNERVCDHPTLFTQSWQGTLPWDGPCPLCERDDALRRLKRREPVSVYNGRDIEWWKARAEQALAAVRHLLSHTDRPRKQFEWCGSAVEEGDRAVAGLPDETTGAPDVNDMFRAGVTQAKYRRYYYEALLRVLNSDRMLSHDIARAAVDGSPEHLPEEPKCGLCGKPGITEAVRTCCGEGRARDLASGRTPEKAGEDHAVV